MSKIRVAPIPAPLAPHEHHRTRCSVAEDRLYGVAEALELMADRGTEYDQLLNILASTCLEQIEVLRDVQAYLEGLGGQAVA